MARGVRGSPTVTISKNGTTATSSGTTTTLPKVSFQKTDEDYSLKVFGVFNLQARSYGFNDFSQFQRPKHYIQYIEPIDSDLARQVEYDMDEQDQEWLDSVNAERKKEQIDTVTYETFEIIMDRLEKEWFDLTKNIPKTDFAMPSEDSTCAICDDSEGENSNAIVFCDGCNLAVHQDCYGVPYIPEGQWLCRKCTVSPENPVSCVLCPNEGGAFKQTVTGDWVHLLCAIWVPETRVANEVFMEPITGVDKISKQRWKLKCSLCEIKEGACIQCAKASCFTAFHATCARREKFLMPMKSTQGAEPVTLTCYCEKHLPKEQQDAREIALERERVEEQEQTNGALLSKSARAYAKTYKPGPPIVPALIINRILNYIAKVQLRKRQEFVQLVARYWSLKREARRGAPLLKRLHLEPWTASGGNSQSEEDKAMKLELLCRLREDLRGIQELTNLTRKRESRKQAQATIIRDMLLGILAPFEHLLRDAYNRIVAIDRTDYFRYPVSKAEVPDYFDVVKKPMYWSVIEDKITSHSYLDSQEFKDDILLVIDNALLYNQPNTAYHKTANRIRAATQPVFEELDRRLAKAKAGMQQVPRPPESVERQNVENTANPEITEIGEGIGEPARKTHQIGDLEPPLEFLQLLVSPDAIRDDTDLVLDKTPLESLFAFELAKLKPPPPPPSPKPTKPKRDRKADLERKRKEREAAAAARALEAQLADAPYARTRRATAFATSTTSAIGLEAEQEEQKVDVEDESEAELEPVSESNRAGDAITREESGFGAVPGEAPVTISAPAAFGPTSSTELQVFGESARRAAQRKRGPSIVPGMFDQPPMVTDVDSRTTFKLFDQGWVLPPGQKRGGRKTVERAPLPPPKKRAKTNDYVASRLSVVSTSASENQTLPQTSPSTKPPSAPADKSAASALAAAILSAAAEHENAAHSFGASISISNLESMDVDTSALRTTISEEPVASRSESVQQEAPEEEVKMSYVPAPSAPSETIPVRDPTPPILSVPSRRSTLSIQTTNPPTQPRPPAPMDVSVSAPYHPPTDDAFQHDGVQPKRVIQGPDGQIIVELLDSPLIRKEKARQKKEERKRLLEQQRLEQLTRTQQVEAQDTMQTQTQVEAGIPQAQARVRKKEVLISAGSRTAAASSRRGVRKQLVDGVEADSELSSLSDVGSEVVETKEAMSISAPVVREKNKSISLLRKASMANFAVSDELGTIQPNQTLEGGTLVWAKAKTYPWWPAVVYESDDPRIPPQVKIEGELMKSKGHAIFMVQFFDKTRSWGFLPHDKLKMLGEYKALDEELLSPKSTKQKWKTTGSRADCRAAYDVAMAEMETHSDIALAETGGIIVPPVEGVFEQTAEAVAAVAEAAFEGGLSMATQAGKTDPERRRTFTPESEDMDIDPES